MNADAISFRVARLTDLNAIIRLLADDKLGVDREELNAEIASYYLYAFKEIENDSNNEIIVAVSDEKIVGVLQLTYIPNLTHRGTRRAMIEGVRIAAEFRFKGLGTHLLNWALNRCRSRGCRLIQLTSDLRREEAISFYEKNGFQYTHAGLKLWLEDD